MASRVKRLPVENYNLIITSPLLYLEMPLSHCFINVQVRQRFVFLMGRIIPCFQLDA